MNPQSFVKLLVVSLAALALVGCAVEDEAKKLGFSSAAEMVDVHLKGWHTKQRYDADKDMDQAVEVLRKEVAAQTAAAEGKKREETLAYLRAQDDDAKALGFADDAERRTAKLAGMDTKATWDKYQAAALEAERLRPKPVDFGDLKRGVEYTWTTSYFGDRNCKNSDEVVCLSKSDYKQMCDASKGITSNGLWGFKISSKYGVSFPDDATSREFSSEWAEEYRASCRANLELSGTIRGNSVRDRMHREVMSFIVDKSGQILVYKTTM